jgi:Tol biopolymer transport system component
MMTPLLLSLALAVPPAAVPARTPQSPQTTVSAITLTPGDPVLELDLRKLKGPLVRQLAWSPDQKELYLQTYEANRDASVKATYHYLIPVAGGEPKAVEVPPGWAVAYQQWKSGQASPNDPTWKIDVATERKIQSATSIPMGGDLARGGSVDPTGGVSVETVVAAAGQSGNVNVYTMRLSGQVVGEWVNHPIVPGLTFGWAPPGTAMIAFADRDGDLAVMDRAGNTVKVKETKDVTLPAWSPDGARIAYLEKTGRTTYVLKIAVVSPGLKTQGS